MSDILLLTTASIPPGKKISRIIGMVEGHSGLHQGENVTQYTFAKITGKTSDAARDDLVAKAKERNANAIIGIQASHSTVKDGHSFVATYTYIGTAVILTDAD